jgi:DNA-binding protein H-NS
MREFDLSGYSIPQLKDILNRIPKEIQSRQKIDRSKVVKELQDMAKAHGFTLEDLLGKQLKKARKHYRHPNVPHLIWNGFGRRPEWVIAFLDSGGKLDDIAFDPHQK